MANRYSLTCKHHLFESYNTQSFIGEESQNSIELIPVGSVIWSHCVRIIDYSWDPGPN